MKVVSLCFWGVDVLVAGALLGVRRYGCFASAIRNGKQKREMVPGEEEGVQEENEE
jgi:hypothetical protein